MVEIEITVRNPNGIHARPASAISTVASRFESEIALLSPDGEVNAKSIMGILTLGAIKGTILTIRTEGEDEKEAAQVLKRLFDNNFKEHS